MIQLGSIVKILPDADYDGKFTGYTGKVEKIYGRSQKNPKVGVQFEGLKNDCPSGLFWFGIDNVEVILDSPFMNYLANDTILTATLMKEFTRNKGRVHREFLPFPDLKKVIFSGPKTIVLWGDGTKTIVSCGEGETYDHYTGFCAAVVKKLFGSTTQAKKVLGKAVQIQ